MQDPFVHFPSNPKTYYYRLSYAQVLALAWYAHKTALHTHLECSPSRSSRIGLTDLAGTMTGHLGLWACQAHAGAFPEALPRHVL
jgi:hypothetical protein